MRGPLVSVIVTTRNNRGTLGACLASIVAQDYQSTELIVVDNNSTDNTKAIAKRYTELVFNKGPERSVQRNYAFKKSKGEYVLIIDSDMELGKGVVSSCVAAADSKVGAVIVPE
jgi:glycosyltransferase involved in cell wall biosynthesis